MTDGGREPLGEAAGDSAPAIASIGSDVAGQAPEREDDVDVLTHRATSMGEVARQVRRTLRLGLSALLAGGAVWLAWNDAAFGLGGIGSAMDRADALEGTIVLALVALAAAWASVLVIWDLGRIYRFAPLTVAVIGLVLQVPATLLVISDTPVTFRHISGYLLGAYPPGLIVALSVSWGRTRLRRGVRWSAGGALVLTACRLVLSLATPV